MKVKMLLLSGFIFALFSTSAMAHPATGIDLSYDPDQKILTADVLHVSDDKDQHYIRKIVVSEGDKELTTEYYHRQVNPTHFEAKIPLVLEVGETITVKAYSSEGGVKEVSLTVTEPKQEDSAEPSVKTKEKIKE